MYRRWLLASISALALVLLLVGDTHAQGRGRAVGHGYAGYSNYGFYNYGDYGGWNRMPAYNYGGYGWNYPGYSNWAYSPGYYSYYYPMYNYSYGPSWSSYWGSTSYSFPSYTYSSPTWRTNTYVSTEDDIAMPENLGARVLVNVRVPAEAQVWFNGEPTVQRGAERSFMSPPLADGTYTYRVKARWHKNGDIIERTKDISVKPGDNKFVDFLADTTEKVNDREMKEIRIPVDLDRDRINDRTPQEELNRVRDVDRNGDKRR